jgi:hypothetical protein
MSDATSDRIRALRHARAIADDLRWREIKVPQIYTRMTDEFASLVQNGEYAAWVAERQRRG